MDKPTGMIDRFAAWAREIRDLYQQLSGDEDYRYRYDPYWVRAEPYRVKLEPGKPGTAELVVRSFGTKSIHYDITIVSPSGLSVEPAVVRLDVAPEGIVRTPLKLSANQPLKGVTIICFDITRDGRHLGPLFDMIGYAP
jgi:hypothetical protein